MYFTKIHKYSSSEKRPSRKMPFLALRKVLKKMCLSYSHVPDSPWLLPIHGCGASQQYWCPKAKLEDLGAERWSQGRHSQTVWLSFGLRRAASSERAGKASASMCYASLWHRKSHVLNTNSLSGKWFESIYWQAVTCLFVLLTLTKSNFDEILFVIFGDYKLNFFLYFYSIYLLFIFSLTHSLSYYI